MIATGLASIQMLDISGNPLTAKDKSFYIKLKETLHRNMSCHLKTGRDAKDAGLSFQILQGGKAKKQNGNSFSLPRLKKINLNASLQGYPRPPVIKTKEVSFY